AVSLREGEIEIATKTRDRYPPQELYWLSRIISAESRGEPLRGQVAVGNVILNRVASPAFPNSVQGVVFDKRNAVQFEPVSNGSIYAAPSPQSVTAAKMALDGSREAGDALYFFAPSLSKGTWIAKNRAYLKTIGCHRFYL
ncbi:MAG: cell wall hydrolase, partial [Ruthenibacterium sp.]